MSPSHPFYMPHKRCGCHKLVLPSAKLPTYTTTTSVAPFAIQCWRCGSVMLVAWDGQRVLLSYEDGVLKSCKVAR